MSKPLNTRRSFFFSARMASVVVSSRDTSMVEKLLCVVERWDVPIARKSPRPCTTSRKSTYLRRRSLIRRQQAERFGQGDGGAAVIDAEFAVEVVGMHLDRAGGHHQGACDLLVGELFVQQAQDVPFALGQGFQPLVPHQFVSGNACCGPRTHRHQQALQVGVQRLVTHLLPLATLAYLLEQSRKLWQVGKGAYEATGTRQGQSAFQRIQRLA